MEDLQPAVADGGRRAEEPTTPRVEQGQGEADLVAPTVEQRAAVEPVGPAVEEPQVTGPISPGGDVG